MTASLERKGGSETRWGKGRGAGELKKGGQGDSLGQRTVVSTGEDPRSCWTHGAPSLTLAPAAPSSLSAAPPPSRPRAESPALQRPPPALPLLEPPLSRTRLQRGAGSPPQPFFPCDSAATAGSRSLTPTFPLGPSRPGDLCPALPAALLPCGPSAAGTWAGPTGLAHGAGSGAAAMPAGSLPSTCSPCAWARAPTAAP